MSLKFESSVPARTLICFRSPRTCVINSPALSAIHASFRAICHDCQS
jgi:hypothetical protein